MTNTEQKLENLKKDIHNLINLRTNEFIDKYPIISDTFDISKDRTILLFFASYYSEGFNIELNEYIEKYNDFIFGISSFYIEKVNNNGEIVSGGFKFNIDSFRGLILNNLEENIINYFYEKNDGNINGEMMDKEYGVMRANELEYFDKINNKYEDNSANIFLYKFLLELHSLITNTFFDKEGDNYKIKPGMKEYVRLTSDIINCSSEFDYIFSLYEPIKIKEDNDIDPEINIFDKYYY